MNEQARRIQRVYLVLVIGKRWLRRSSGASTRCSCSTPGSAISRPSRRTRSSRRGWWSSRSDRSRRGHVGPPDLVPARHAHAGRVDVPLLDALADQAPFWTWAIVSMLLGLGFTFFSGAVEARLVDALRYANYPGASSWCSAGSGGRRCGDARRLGCGRRDRPGDLARSAVPASRRRPAGDVRRRVAADARSRLHPGARRASASRHQEGPRRVHRARPEEPARALGDAGGAILDGCRHLRLLRAAAVPARAVRRRGRILDRGPRGCGGRRRRSPAAGPRRAFAGCSGSARRRSSSPASPTVSCSPCSESPKPSGSASRWSCSGARLGGRAADPAGLSERDDPVAATRDGALVRLADGRAAVW